MAPYYASITAVSPSPLKANPELLEKLKKANAETLAGIDTRLATAKELEGETEISEALRARADFLTRIGEKDTAIEAQKLALEKTPGLGSKIDVVLTLVRIGFFWADNDLITWAMAKAETCVIYCFPLISKADVA